jgi:hypothetical protein
MTNVQAEELVEYVAIPSRKVLAFSTSLPVN